MAEIGIHVKSGLELTVSSLGMNPVTLGNRGWVAKKGNTVLGFIPRNVEFHSGK